MHDLPIQDTELCTFRLFLLMDCFVTGEREEWRVFGGRDNQTDHHRGRHEAGTQKAAWKAPATEVTAATATAATTTTGGVCFSK